MKKPTFIGIDPARPGSDRTVMTVHGGRRMGKTAELEREIEKALDAGHDVYDTRTGEYRGPGSATDVTPKPLEFPKLEGK